MEARVQVQLAWNIWVRNIRNVSPLETFSQPSVRSDLAGRIFFFIFSFFLFCLSATFANSTSTICVRIEEEEEEERDSRVKSEHPSTGDYSRASLSSVSITPEINERDREIVPRFRGMEFVL